MKKIYYDLHIHTVLSPCGGDDNTPNNVVNMAKLKGLDVIAISDHNTVGNVLACQKIGQKIGLKVLCGMELTCEEEVHVLCLFEQYENAKAFGELVSTRQMKIKNKIEVFGHQQYMDENDSVLKEEENLLLMATDIGVYEISSLVKNFDGIAIPAHIDKEGSGLVKMLGFIDPLMGFDVFEVSKHCQDSFLKDLNLEQNIIILHNSDAHYLEDINEGEEEDNMNFIHIQDLNKNSFLRRLFLK